MALTCRYDTCNDGSERLDPVRRGVRHDGVKCTADPVRQKVIRTDGSDHDDRVGGVAVIRLDGATRKIR